MEIGVYAVFTDETVRPGEGARRIEEAGIDALHLGEHSHIPASRESPAPGGGELRRDYIRLLDLFVGLTAAAATTTRLRLSSGILQLAQRDPIHTAKEIATLDLLSDGRTDFIVRHGWNIEEMRNHGVDPERRYDLVREKMQAMRAIWREDEASFHGELVDFDRIWVWPKPVQAGGVPLFYGGNSPGSEEKALEYGDGWAPIAFPGTPERIAAFTEAHPGVPVVAFGVQADAAALEAYAKAGTHRVVLSVETASADALERSLEELARTVTTAVR